MRKIIANPKGANMIELLVATAIGCVVLLGTMSISRIMVRSQSQSNLTFNADQTRRNLTNFVNTVGSWKNTIEADANKRSNGPALDCLIAPGTPCTTSGTDLPGQQAITDQLINQIYDSGNNLVYDASTPNLGMTSQGLPCDGFVPPPAAGNDSCPIRFEVRWSAICSPTTCVDPQVNIAIVPIYNPGSNSSSVLNPANYSANFIRVPGGLDNNCWLLTGTFLLMDCPSVTNIGIGTPNPQAFLEVFGPVLLGQGNAVPLNGYDQMSILGGRNSLSIGGGGNRAFFVGAQNSLDQGGGSSRSFLIGSQNNVRHGASTLLSVLGSSNVVDTSTGGSNVTSILGGSNSVTISGGSSTSVLLGQANIFNANGGSHTFFAAGTGNQITPGQQGTTNVAIGKNNISNSGGGDYVALGESNSFTSAGGGNNLFFAIGNNNRFNTGGAGGRRAFAFGRNHNLTGGGTVVAIGEGIASADSDSILLGLDKTTLSITRGNAVGIGNSSPSAMLDVSGSIRGMGITDASDLRLKENIQPLESSLAKILKLRGVSYYWKDSKQDPDMQIGLIAQEVEAEFPELVKTDKHNLKSLNYSHLVAPIIESIKSLWQSSTESDERLRKAELEIEKLKAEIELLKVSK